MYYYIYDNFLNDRKYDKLLDMLKTKLLDLDIKGKHERLSLLKNLDSLIIDEVRRGAQTIVVVGNDNIFLKAIDIVAKKDVTLGIIPVGLNNKIATSLGIDSWERSCEILSARKIAHLDLGQVNNVYFFSNVRIKKNIDRISVSHQGYRVIPKITSTQVAIYNYMDPQEKAADAGAQKSCPQDNLLDLIIKSEQLSGVAKGFFGKKKEEKIDSLLQGINFEIKSFEYLPVMIDDYRIIKTPASVKLADKKLKLIVGKCKNLIIK